MENEKRLDLIDRSALGIGRCNPDAFPLKNRGFCAGWNGVIDFLEQAPRVDAVEVVLCKNCKRWEATNTMRCDGYCHNTKFHLHFGKVIERCFMPLTKDNDFCSYGERREGE